MSRFERPLSRVEIERHAALPGRIVSRALKDLVRRGDIERRGGRWLAKRRIVDDELQPGSAPLPRIEGATRRPSRAEAAPATKREVDWNAFRGLCRYYAECIDLESGGRAEVDPDDERQYVELSGSIDWLQLGRGAKVRLPSSTAVGDLVSRCRRGGAERKLRIGAPLELAKTRRSGEQRLLPVFLIAVVVTRERGGVYARAETPPRVNEAWLESRFPQVRSEQRDDLLIRLGLYQEEEVEGGLDVVPSHALDLQTLWQNLIRTESERFSESGGPDRLQSGTAPRRSGLYHRALLLAPNRASFQGGLLDELEKLSKRPDEELRGTALAAFFDPDAVEASREPAELPTLRPEYQPLNPEQREVVSLSFDQPLTAVQGPPGTGKSTVVTHVMTAHALEGQSVLFASRNHQALEAVVPRLQAIHEDRPLILRLTASKRDEERRADDWLSRATGLLARPADPSGQEARAAASERLAAALRSREERERDLRDHIDSAERLVRQNARLAELEAGLPQELRSLPDRAGPLLNTARLQQIERSLESSAPLVGPIRRALAATRLRREIRRVERVDESMRARLPMDSPAAAGVLRRAAQIAELRDETARFEAELRPLPSRMELADALAAADEAVRETTKRALEALAEALGTEISPELKRLLVDLRGELGGRSVGNKIHRLHSSVRNTLEKSFAQLVDVFPLWACSNLSVRSRLPLVPGAFDLVIVDEASQCDIASCLPLLYRAKRAMIVGDPMQLKHIGKVARETEDRLRELNRVDGVALGSFRYTTNSIWDPAFAVAQGPCGETRMLKEHWRCHPAIAGYFSNLFYDGKLRVRTPENELVPLVRGQKRLRGIEWTHVPGGSETAPGGSRFHTRQIEAIVDELKRVAKDGYDGSVGVVTPFRAHANRIRDRVNEEIPRETLQRWRFASETADGFQGDERDLVVFGLVGGPDPANVPPFYARDRNRFNVAISRARSLLHVFGDRDWAAECGQEVLSALVRAWHGSQEQAEQPMRSDLIGPVWEPRLAEEMRDAGLAFHQQYRACGYYLDFALFRPGIRLDVEVDGETYHRDSSGERREEDLRRDQILRAAGWRVLRFWVYQLRDDMEACIERIRECVEQE